MTAIFSAANLVRHEGRTDLSGARAESPQAALFSIHTQAARTSPDELSVLWGPKETSRPGS